MEPVTYAFVDGFTIARRNLTRIIHVPQILVGILITPLMRAVVPDPALRRGLLAELRPQPWAFWEEPIPVFPGRPDAPCAYLRFAPNLAYNAAAAGRTPNSAAGTSTCWSIPAQSRRHSWISCAASPIAPAADALAAPRARRDREAE